MIDFMRLRLLLGFWIRRVRFCDCCFFLDRIRLIDFMRLLVGLRRVRFCACFFFFGFKLKNIRRVSLSYTHVCPRHTP